MPSYNVNAGPIHFHGGSFRPKGELYDCCGDEDARENPRKTTGAAFSARLFVGFNVGPAATYTIDDLIDLVYAEREAAGRPFASFLAQRGIYRHDDGSRVVEDGGQVIILATWKTTERAFLNEMTRLGEYLAKEMRQESILLEVQKRGVQIGTWWVTPPPTKRPKRRKR